MFARASSAEYLVAAGRLDEAASVIAEVDRLLATGEEQLARWFVPLARAGLFRARGDDRAAAAVLQEAIALQDREGARGPLLRTAIALAELAVDQGRGDAAAEVLDHALAGSSAGSDAPYEVIARRLRADVGC